MKKVIISLVSVLFLSTSIFANEESQAYKSTAGTIKDNTYYLFNLTEWQSLNYDKYITYLDLTQFNRGYFSGAKKLKNKGLFGISWNGDLWGNNVSNEIEMMYGNKNFSIIAGGEFSNNSAITSSTTSYSTNYFSFKPLVKIGYVFNKKSSFEVGTSFKMASADYSTTEQIEQTVIGASAKFNHTINSDKKMNDYFSLGYEGLFSNTTILDLSEIKNVITGEFGLNYKIKPEFVYGFKAVLPVTLNFTNDILSTKIEASISNGFSTKINDIVTLNAGLCTTLPFVQIVQDEDDLTFGSLGNIFYGGVTFNIKDFISLDLCGTISPDHTSLSELWDKNFAISVTAKF